MTRLERAERDTARRHDQGRAEQVKEAVREFNEARVKKKSRPLRTAPSRSCFSPVYRRYLVSGHTTAA